jgi:CheY-like chemotaxis protein
MALVLVIDDELLIRMNAVELIKQAGHRVIEATNADEAIQILESRVDIEVVFSDVTMPGSMDGLKLVHYIRNRWPPIRLILASGKGLPLGAKPPEGAVFLCKPYDYGDLVGALARAA